MKIKIGGRPLREDVERVRLAREALGPDRKLALDVNNAWGSVAEALGPIARLAEHDLWWVEEPLSPEDVHGHAQLVRRTGVPIATGEIEATRWGFAALIEADAADILQPDACVCGGIRSGSRSRTWRPRTACRLRRTGTRMCTSTSLRRLQLPRGRVVRYRGGLYNFDLVLAEHLIAHDGMLEVPMRPGVGLVLDEDAVARFTSWSSSRPDTAGARARPARSPCAATPPPGSGTR